MIYITHVRLAGGTGHEHISQLKWQNPSNTKTGENSRQEIVDWLRKAGSAAKVSQAGRTVDVGIVETKPPYLRTHADGVWTDNLLALPRF